MKILITGAAGGIGEAASKAAIQAGHEVVRQDKIVGPTVDIAGDLLDAAFMKTLLVRCIAENVDAVIAAHGIAAARSLRDVDLEYFNRAMQVNTLTVLRLYDALAEHLKMRDGTFVVISSQAGLYGEANNGAYCASKFALVGWAEGLKVVGAGCKVRILCPGATATPLLRSAFEGMATSTGVQYEDILRERTSKIPAGRLGHPAEIGHSAIWLATLPAPHVLVAAVTGGEVLR